MVAYALHFGFLIFVITAASLKSVLGGSLPPGKISNHRTSHHLGHPSQSTASPPSSHFSCPPHRTSSERKCTEGNKFNPNRLKTSKHVASKASHSPSPTGNDYLWTAGSPIVHSRLSTQRFKSYKSHPNSESLSHTTLTTFPSSRKNIKHLRPIATGIIYNYTGPASSGSVTVKHNKFRTQTLSGVTGAPSSFSQTRTTDSSGHSTVLPIWFGPLGAGIVIVPVAAGLGGVIPPPPGYPPLEIGPDGQASRVPRSDLQSPRDRSTPTTPSHKTSFKSLSTSRPSIASSSRPSSISSSILATTTSVPLWLIFPKSGKDAANSRLTTELTHLFGRDLYISQNALSGVVFWRAPLNSAQRNQYNASAIVSKVTVVLIRP